MNKNLDKVLGRGNYSRIARDVGVTRQHISRVLRGLSNYSTGLLEKISSVTGCTKTTILAYRHVQKELRR